jgi:hypothetical protein
MSFAKSFKEKQVQQRLLEVVSRQQVAMNYLEQVNKLMQKDLEDHGSRITALETRLASLENADRSEGA